MKRHIPNMITCANLFSGCIGIVFAFNGDLKMAAWMVLLSGIFDFFDGFAARLLHVKSNIGKELDSLADVISFGLLPGVVLFKLLAVSDYSSEYLPYFGFLVTVFSAFRLAKFNVDERQTENFIGLNTPMNTFLIVSLPFIGDDYPLLIDNSLLLIGLIVVVCFLLVSEIKLFSMKFTTYAWQSNKFKYIFLILSVLLISFINFAAIPFIVILYITFSVLHFKSTA